MKFSEILIKINIFFFQENVFENVVCKMSAILSQPQCVNSQKPDGNRVCVSWSAVVYVMISHLIVTGSEVVFYKWEFIL